MGQRRLLFNLLLLGGCLLLLWGIVSVWWGENDAATGAKAPVGLDLPKVPALRGQEPLDAYRLVTEKNLFSPDRRGEGDAKPTKAQASLEGGRLVGVIIIGVERAALISDPGKAARKTMHVVRRGERWGNYEVLEISSQGVVLQGREGRKVLDFPD